MPELNNTEVDREKLDYLMEISTRDKKEKRTEVNIKYIDFEQDKFILNSKNDTIKIGDTMVNISNFNAVTKKILENCNFIESKSHSNNTSLVKGTGKLCFTNGMSIGEFRRNFKLEN